MDQRPDDLERAIDRTRQRLGRDLRRLGRKIDVLREDAASQAQFWTGVTAVAAGVVGAIVFWPRRA